MAELTVDQGSFPLSRRGFLLGREIEDFKEIPPEFFHIKVFADVFCQEHQRNVTHAGRLVGDLPPKIQLDLWRATKAARRMDYAERIS